jgi:hypothetical protein
MSDAVANARRRERLDALGVIAVVLLCTTYTFPRWADWNQNSRFDLTRAIVDEGTLSIDCCVANTGDYALFEGRAYSDKAPGLSVLAVAPYVLWNTISRYGLGAAANRLAHSDAVQGTLRAGGTGIRDDKMAVATALIVATFFTVALPAALASALLFHFLATFTADRGSRIAVALTYALATIAYPYSNAFYAHQLVAALLFAAFVSLFTLPRARHIALRLVAIGFLLGLALVSEYPTALIVAVLLVYAAYQMRRGSMLTPASNPGPLRHSRAGGNPSESTAGVFQMDPRLRGDDGTRSWSAKPVTTTLGWIAAGMLPPLLGAAAYHLAIFHTPWPVAYRYSALWQERHAVGFISITYPHLGALWGITFSPYRGLFAISPVLLLSLWGLWDLWQRRAQRAAVAVSTAAVTSFLAFNSASAMWWGGFAVGPRYLMPMLPFLAWPLIAFLDRSATTRWHGWLFGVLAVASLLITWSLSLAGQHFPEDTHLFPLLDYAVPQLWQGNLARNVGTLLGLSGWLSLAPLVIACSALGGTWWALTRR